MILTRSMVLMAMKKLKNTYLLILVAALMVVSSHAVLAEGQEDPLVIIKSEQTDLVPVKTTETAVVTQETVQPQKITETKTVATKGGDKELIKKEAVIVEEDARLPAQVVSVRNAYRIGPGDKLEITVYGEDDLSKTYLVDGQGYISVPLVGNLLIADLTPLQVERLLEERFSDGYLVDPSIAIEIVEYRPFYIIGEIRRPGSYNYIDGMNVLNAVAVGGGFTYRAKTGAIEVIRPVDGGNQSFILKPEDPVLPGDILRIKERFF